MLLPIDTAMCEPALAVLVPATLRLLVALVLKSLAMPLSGEMLAMVRVLPMRAVSVVPSALVLADVSTVRLTSLAVWVTVPLLLPWVTKKAFKT